MNRRKGRRFVRIRNELRLWLRAHCGHRLSYTQKEIDNGREELGFSSADDAFIAYSVFGADLAPTIIGNLDSTILAEEFSNLLAVDAGDPTVALDFFDDN